MKSFNTSLACILFLTTISVSAIFAQDFPYDKEIWPSDLRIGGNLIVCGRGDVSDKLRNEFLELAYGEDASLVCIWLGEPKEATKTWGKSFRDSLQVDKFTISSEWTLADAETTTKIANSLAGATGVWIGGSNINEQQAELVASLRIELKQIIDDGGVAMFSNSAAKLAGRLSAYEADGIYVQNEELNLLPDTIIQSGSSPTAATAVQAAHPRLVRVSIPQQSAIVLSGRKISVRGEGEVEFLLMGNERQSYRVKRVREYKAGPRNPYTYRVDLTAWRRDAIDRTLPEFPPAEPAKPTVENGSLVIVGGGGMPDGLFDQFIEMAGGKDAKLIYVPCTEADEVRPTNRLVESWKDKVASATVFHTKDREKADSDEEFLRPLKEATGIWFGGGRQWNFVDSYYGTKAHEYMFDVLKRGGVIGGSSAGASVQGEYLARANPLANFDIMAAGYERGLGFLQGVAIDQHFTQRNRQPNMTELVNTYPQLLGIGIDETTAIVVQKSKAKVVGRGSVFFYDRNQPVYPDKPDYIALEDGQVFDLAERKVDE